MRERDKTRLKCLFSFLFSTVNEHKLTPKWLRQNKKGSLLVPTGSIWHALTQMIKWPCHILFLAIFQLCFPLCKLRFQTGSVQKGRNSHHNSSSFMFKEHWWERASSKRASKSYSWLSLALSGSHVNPRANHWVPISTWNECHLGAGGWGQLDPSHVDCEVWSKEVVLLLGKKKREINIKMKNNRPPLQQLYCCSNIHSQDSNNLTWCWSFCRIIPVEFEAVIPKGLLSLIPGIRN